MPSNPPTRPKKQVDEVANNMKRVEALEMNDRVQDECLKNIDEDIDRMTKALWGNNGNVGVIGRIKVVEDVITDVKRLLWAILGVVLGIAAGGIYQAIVHAANAP